MCRECGGAAHELVLRWWPVWGERARASRILGPLRRSEDVVRDVQTAMAEKFLAPERFACERLEAWLLRNPDRVVDDWMRIAQSNVMRSVMRAELSQSRGLCAQHVELGACEAVEQGSALELESTVLAAELAAFAARRLPPWQQGAIAHWLTGEVDAGRDPAEWRAVRAGLATLRRAFAA